MGNYEEMKVVQESLDKKISFPFPLIGKVPNGQENIVQATMCMETSSSWPLLVHNETTRDLLLLHHSRANVLALGPRRSCRSRLTGQGTW